ncbi:rhodanese-like domain-containing protein [Lutibacter sp.]
MKTSIKLLGLLSLSIIFASLSCKNAQEKNNKLTNDTIVNATSVSNTTQETKGKITLLSPSEFKEKSKDHQIIDVRTPSEFKEGFIEGAKNINLKDDDFAKEITSLDKDKPVYIYCRSGHRSGIAAKKMIDLGFKEVYDLQGGILNWEQSNNEVKN